MPNALVPIIMSNQDDQAHAANIQAALARYDISTERRVASPFKSAGHLLTMLTKYEQDPRPKVYITISGTSSALAGMVDGATTWPVIACPSQPNDTVLASVRVPAGMGPALVLSPGGAAQLAAKILAVSDADLRATIQEEQRAQVERLVAQDGETQGASA